MPIVGWAFGPNTLRNHDDQKIALCNLLNAIFPCGHLLQAKSMAKAVAVAFSSKEPPEMIMVYMDIPDLPNQTMRWIRTVLFPSQNIVLISRIDEAIDAMNAGARAMMLKHRVIPFLTKLFSNMEGAIRSLEPAYTSKDTSPIVRKTKMPLKASCGESIRPEQYIQISMHLRTKNR